VSSILQHCILATLFLCVFTPEIIASCFVCSAQRTRPKSINELGSYKKGSGNNRMISYTYLPEYCTTPLYDAISTNDQKQVIALFKAGARVTDIGCQIRFRRYTTRVIGKKRRKFALGSDDIIKVEYNKFYETVAYIPLQQLSHSTTFNPIEPHLAQLLVKQYIHEILRRQHEAFRLEEGRKQDPAAIVTDFITVKDRLIGHFVPPCWQCNSYSDYCYCEQKVWLDSAQTLYITRRRNEMFFTYVE
jgi:hypothetical protein